MGVVIIPPGENTIDPLAEVRREVVKLLRLYPALVQALADFHLQKKDGVVELHFTRGGLANITSRQVKVYKC